MAWPSTPLTTYVAGTTPWIKAVDMNAIQAGVTGIINGTYSLKGAYIDGTGGSLVTSPAGSLTISGATGGGTAAPTTARPQGQLFKDAVTLGWARAYWDGAAMVMSQGYNVLSLARTGIGAYTVVFQPVVSNAARAGILTACGRNPDLSHPEYGLICDVLQVSNNGGRIEVHVQMLDPHLGPNVVEAGPDLSNWFYVEAKGELEMPCEITDQLGYMAPDGSFVPLAGQQVFAVPGSPDYRVSYSGTFRPLIGLNPNITSAALKHGVLSTTDASGQYTFTLPYAAAETKPADPAAVWSLVFPDGSILTGSVPTDPGPLAVDDLVASSGWTWADQVYVAPATGGVFAKGTVQFSASGTATVVFLTPFVANTYQIELTPSVDSVDGTIPRVAWASKTTSGFDVILDTSNFTGSCDWEAWL